MSIKRNNKYRIVLQELELKDGTKSNNQSIEFEFENHDNILSLIEMTKNSERFENKADNIEFAVGLKLLGEVLMRNRTNPLFENFAPAFGELMKKLKRK